MANYFIRMRVDYAFEIEADSPEDAEAKAWTYDYTEDTAAYDGVYSIDVEELYEDEEEDE